MFIYHWFLKCLEELPFESCNKNNHCIKFRSLLIINKRLDESKLAFCAMIFVVLRLFLLQWSVLVWAWHALGWCLIRKHQYHTYLSTYININSIFYCIVPRYVSCILGTYLIVYKILMPPYRILEEYSLSKKTSIQTTWECTLNVI